MKLTLRMCCWKTRLPEGLSVSAAAENFVGRVSEPYAICHRYWALDYCYEGGGLYKVGDPRGAWLERPAFRAHLYAPGVSYWEKMDGVKLPFHCAFVCFWGGEALGLEGPCVVFQDDERLLGGLLKQLADLGQSRGEAGFWDAQALLCQMVGMMSRSEPGDVRRIRSIPAAGEGRETLSDKVEALLERDLASDIPLEELARRLSVSVSTLTHVHRRETGESVVQVRNRLRMERAKYFLSMGAPLKHIAEELGFCDVYHLSKTFKKLVGKTPRQFAKDGALA